MKNFLLLITFLFAMTSVSAQTAVIVNSPPSIAGAKLFGVATDWGANLASGTWTADAALLDDGTGASPNDGCEPAINAGDLAGKIVLVDRGSCEFGAKALAAENAGAIGVLIVNNVAGGAVQDMGGGAVGASVTIPVALISLEDGAAIKAELLNGAVNITMGAVIFNDNISIDAAKVLNAPYGTVPLFEVENGQFEVIPGGTVLNKGNNDAENVIIQANIDHEGSQVYSEADQVDFIASGDTSDLVTLPGFTPTESGQYDLSYEVTFDNADESDFDNTVSSSFYVSENVFSKAQWDEDNDRPARTNAYTIAGGGNIMFLSGFHLSDANGTTLDSARFYVSTALDSFGLLASDSEVRVYAFIWRDANGDGTADDDEWETVAFNTVELDPTASEQWVTVELLEFSDFDGQYTITEDTANVFIAPRFEGTELMYFGFDESLDHTQYVNNFITSDLEYPYLQTNTWDPDTGTPSALGLFNNGMGGTFLASVATALYVTPFVSNTQEPLLTDVTVSIYPNPAIDRFTTTVELPAMSNFLEYTIRDASGRQLFSTRKENVQMDKAEFNVSALPVGHYYLMVRTENGVATYPVSVQR